MPRVAAGTAPSGATAVYNFPYPEPDDVHDIAHDIRVLAEAINTALNNLIPRGVIAAFPFVAIPAGWQVCDGTNGTPNLTDRFIRGAGPVAAGVAGGSHTHALTVAEMPSHAHTVNFGAPSGGHAHGNGTITGRFVTTEGDHVHGTAQGVPWSIHVGAWGQSDFDGTGNNGTWLDRETDDGWADLNPAAPGHGHAFGVPAFGSGGPSNGHDHGGGATVAAGAGAAFNITPLYYSVVYAMKM